VIVGEDVDFANTTVNFTILDVAGYAILFLLAFYFIVAALRLMIRKKRQV
jgi:hypothetical protein